MATRGGAKPRPGKLALPPSNRNGASVLASNRSVAQRSQRGSSAAQSSHRGGSQSTLNAGQQSYRNAESRPAATTQPNRANDAGSMATQLVDTHDESLPETLAVVEAKEDITEPPAELDVVAEAEAHHFEDPETEPTTWDLLAIACRLLYEVLEPTFLVRVALDLESDLVMAEPLAVGTRVHALWMCEVNEESIGVHVALENQSQPLGWITFLVGSTSMQPVDRQMHEVISARPVLARADAMLSSSEVGRLGIGQLVLVLQDLGQEDGSRRDCVELEGNSAPLGWIM